MNDKLEAELNLIASSENAVLARKELERALGIEQKEE